MMGDAFQARALMLRTASLFGAAAVPVSIAIATSLYFAWQFAGRPGL